MDLFFIMSYLVFFLVFGVIIYTLIKGIAEWGKNNRSPRLSVDATIVDKRSHTTHHHHDNHTTRSTAYYVTFEFQSGDRMELRVPDGEYGLLVSGDVGLLSFQGTRYLAFERKI